MKQRTSHKRRGFISMLWMPLTLYLVLLVSAFVVLTLHDTHNVWNAMDETLDFAVARLEQYSNAMSNDRAKSEIRLLDKTAEISSRIAETGQVTDGQLDQYAYAQRLTGIVILDADMNAVVQTTIDGDTAAVLQSILQKPTVREIVDYPVKAYMTRTQVGDRTVDFAAVAREDAPGLVVAYAEREEEDASDMKLETLFSGFTFEMEGAVTVSDGKTIIASSSAEIIGRDVRALEANNIPHAQWDESGRLHIADGMTAWSGKRTAFENYSVYAMFPDLAVYNSRNTILLYGTLIYMATWLCFAWLRAQQSRRALERNSEQARIISAISEIYCFTFLVNVQRGTVRIIKHPVERLMKMDCTWSMNEVVQMQAAQNVAPDFREAFISYCDLTTLPLRLKENPNLTLEFRDPTDKVYLMTTLPQNYDRRGRLESVLMVTQDVTAEKERERDYQLQLEKTAEDAERANIAKTDFLRRMSHDIRTPINGIRGMVEISRRYAGDEAKQEECREKIMTTSGFLLDLVNDVLNMNKLESGAVTLEEKPFNLRQMISEIVTTVEGQAWRENVQVSCKTLAWNHENLIGSPMHLHQVLQNVVGNAVKYNRPGGSVTISCEEKGFDGTTAMFLFTCTDTGRGMSAAFQQHAFEAFAQEESGARTAYKGTGLGLPIAKELAEQMGGEIRFESELGVGTTFYITLPFRVDPNPPEAESAKPEQAASIKGAHVLLVEDNELNMEISQYILEAAGVIVDQAWNGQEAVRRFSESEPGTFDCILMDVMMPLMDGLEATRTIRAMQRPDAATIPIVAMTANTFSEDEQRSREAGMNLFLNKPVDSEKMLQTVLECLKMGGKMLCENLDKNADRV